MNNAALSQLDGQLLNALKARITASSGELAAKLKDLETAVAIARRSPNGAMIRECAEKLLSDGELDAAQRIRLEQIRDEHATTSDVVPPPQTSKASTAEHSGIREVDSDFVMSPEIKDRLIARYQRQPERWPVPLPFHDMSWDPVEIADLEHIVEQVMSVPSVHQDERFTDLLTSATSGRVVTLSFYEDAKVYELLIAPEQGVARTLVVQASGDTLVFFDGTSPMIHEYNATRGIDLSNKDKALQYLHFFCAFVRGEEGAFNVISDPSVLKVRCTASSSDVADTIDNLQQTKIGEWTGAESPNKWEIHTNILYGDAVFKAHFAIQDSGMIEMLEDDPIAGDLPVRGDKFFMGWRVLMDEG